MFKEYIRTHVGVLIFHSPPVAIVWLVAAVHITTFDGVLIAWGVTHIGIERLKAILPCLTYLDSSGTVPLVLLSIGIQTPLLSIAY
jgi:hypothetical protein